MEVLERVIAILGLSGRVVDGAARLEQVCEMLRTSTRATTAAVFAVGEPLEMCLATAGRPAVPPGEGEPGALVSLARLAEQRQGLVVAPPGTDPSGASLPIWSDGEPVGVLAVHWSDDRAGARWEAPTLLHAASAVCAASVAEVLRERAEVAQDRESGRLLIGVSEAMARIRRAVTRTAASPFPVLIEGESGSGKELVARALHRASARGQRAFCSVNCAALSDELLESELFGHARGAFSGAVADRPGLFEAADKGTLFLDEVSDLSGRGQAKLLRAIQEGEIRRVGENAARRVDLRLIAATNRVLAGEVEGGRFRPDLRYRLEVVRLVVPPLRERAEDIPLLVRHFWAQTSAQAGTRASLAPATVAALTRYPWPGNVRELQNVMAALAVRVTPRGQVGPESLPAHIADGRRSAPSLHEARRHFERGLLRGALARAGGHRGRAAAELGLSRQGLTKMVKRLALD